MSRFKLTERDLEWLREAHEDESYPAMARRIGCCVDTLKRILVREGLQDFDGAKYQVKRKSIVTLVVTPPTCSCQVSSITSLAQSWWCYWTANASCTGKQTISSLIPSSITSLRIWPSQFCAKMPQPLKSFNFLCLYWMQRLWSFLLLLRLCVLSVVGLLHLLSAERTKDEKERPKESNYKSNSSHHHIARN